MAEELQYLDSLNSKNTLFLIRQLSTGRILTGRRVNPEQMAVYARIRQQEIPHVPFVRDIRNALIPAQSHMGWNGNFGISNPDTSDKSKHAYEMCKATQYSGKFSPQYILRLTGQPLMLVDLA